METQNDTDGRSFRGYFVNTLSYSDIDAMTKNQVLFVQPIWDTREKIQGRLSCIEVAV